MGEEEPRRTGSGGYNGTGTTPGDLNSLLDRIAEAAERDHVSIQDVLDALGHRSFGPILVLAGLVILAPLVGDVPGVPTVMGALVLMTAGQVLLGRRSFWLPRVLLSRSIAKEKVHRSVEWLRRPARIVDRIIRPRLKVLVRGPAAYVIAVICIFIGLGTPPMELIPFSANGAGLALFAFGLAFIGQDGLLALIAGIATVGTFWVVISTSLSYI